MPRPKKVKVIEEEVIDTPVESVEEVTTPEVELYNGKKVVSKGEVEINGVIRKTITTEEGSTYTI